MMRRQVMDNAIYHVYEFYLNSVISSISVLSNLYRPQWTPDSGRRTVTSVHTMVALIIEIITIIFFNCASNIVFALLSATKSA